MAFDTTLLLLAYNQSSLIERAVAGAFSQTGAPIEILLSDDLSPDDTVDKMRRMAAAYTGPHHVRVRQSAVNRGLVAHIENAVAESEGKLIVVAAGDDISHPQRVQRLREAWRAAGGGAAFLYSDVQPVGTDGQPTTFHGEQVHPGPHHLVSMARGRISTLGATGAFTRDLIENFPNIDQAVRHEDRVLPFRAALLQGRVIFVDEKLIDYTIEGGISRSKPRDKADYLTRWTRDLNLRTVQDAYQRLKDAKHVEAPAAIIRACRRAIASQEALIKLTGATGLGLELTVLQGAMRGAEIKALARHYLKFRLPVGRNQF